MPRAKSRTRNFTNRGSHFDNIWALFSFKSKCDVNVYSDIALGYWLIHLEFDTSITRYEMHPVPLKYRAPSREDLAYRRGYDDKWPPGMAFAVLEPAAERSDVK